MTMTFKKEETRTRSVSLSSEISRDGKFEIFTATLCEKRGGQWYILKQYSRIDKKKAVSAFNRYKREM